MKSHICLNQHKMRNNFEEVITHLYTPLNASYFGMKFISTSLRGAKQMRKIIYYRALFILHKNVKPSHVHDVIKKVVFDSHPNENRFMV